MPLFYWQWICGLDTQGVFAPAKDHVEMNTAVQKIQSVAFGAWHVVFDLRRSVADLCHDGTALVRFGIHPRGDGEPFAVITGRGFVTEVRIQSAVEIKFAVKRDALPRGRSNVPRRPFLKP